MAPSIPTNTSQQLAHTPMLLCSSALVGHREVSRDEEEEEAQRGEQKDEDEKVRAEGCRDVGYGGGGLPRVLLTIQRA